MFSEPLRFGDKNPDLRWGTAIDNYRGLFILQGWAFQYEHVGGVGHMEKVQHEDRVYLNNINYGGCRSFLGL